MHHFKLAAGCHFGSSVIQSGRQLVLEGELTPDFFLRGSDPFLQE